MKMFEGIGVVLGGIALGLLIKKNNDLKNENEYLESRVEVLTDEVELWGKIYDSLIEKELD